MASRQQNLRDAGVDPYISTRQGSKTGGAWTAASISPGELPIPAGFLTPEEIAKQSKPFTQSKFFTPEDFLISPAALNDPKLASMTYKSTPQNTPLKVGASISAFSNTQAPAFLTNAVNQLNNTQSLQAASQEQFRQQLLDAVLGGNYLAAEALRASAVTPGAKVGFGGAVQNPQVGQAAVIGAQANQTQANAVVESLNKPNEQSAVLQSQLKQVQQKLGSVPQGFAGGQDRAALTAQQFAIQREIANLQKAGPQISIGVNANGYVPRSGLGVI